LDSVGVSAARPASGSSVGAAAGSARDLRLDFFRGVALFSIFVDHIPNNILARFTLQSAALADAAEVLTPEQRRKIDEQVQWRRDRWRSWHRG